MKDNNTLAHEWANQVRDEGRGSNYRYDGPALFSYAECIAKLLPNNYVAITYKRWSNTTARHISMARQATRGRTVVYCRDPSGSPHYNLDRAKETIEYDMLHFPQPVYKKDGKETENSKRKRGNAVKLILDEINQINAYLRAVGREELLLEIPDDIEAKAAGLSAEVAKRKAEEKKRCEDEQARIANEARADLAAWKNHNLEGRQIRSGFSALPVALRLMPNDAGLAQVVETSWGANIPVTDALRVWRWVKVARRLKMDITPDDDLPREQTHLGHYRLERISKEGNMKVGCHIILYGEIEAIAKALELSFEAEPV